MYSRIGSIALNTFREAARARVLYGLVGVAIATSLYAVAVGSFTLRAASRVISDIGGASISFYSVIVAIVLAASSLYRELQHKTVFPILARPIHRAEYIFGKYLGTVLTLATFIAIDGFVVLLTLAAVGGRPITLVLGVGLGAVSLLAIAVSKLPRWGTFLPIPWSLLMLVVSGWMASVVPGDARYVLGMCLFSLLEVSIITALATLIASFSSTFLTAVFTLGVFVIGRNADSLANLPEKVFGSFGKGLGAWVSKVVPNLHVYVPERTLLTGEAVDLALGPHLVMSGLHALGWSIVLLVGAMVVFQRRDFL